VGLGAARKQDVPLMVVLRDGPFVKLGVTILEAGRKRAQAAKD
jgi:hypothetical protein